MELSQGEKLILLMLSEVYDRLEVKGETDTKFIRDAIYGGHTWALTWKLQGIPAKDTPDALADEVSKILAMWEYAERSIERLSPEDQQKVRDSVEFYELRGRFFGFDGNEESEQYSVARFLVEEMGQFEYYKTRDLYSHSPNLDRYRAMLPAYQEMLSPSLRQGWGFSADQLIRLLSIDV